MIVAESRRRVVVLGASGATGTLLVDEALSRGHDVHALVRDRSRYDHAPHPRLTVHEGDVRDAASIAAAITADSVVMSGLGSRSKDDAGVLAAGARALLAAQPARVIWLGAVGTGRSSGVVGLLAHKLLKVVLGAEYDDKVIADGLILDAGETVIHAGPLTNKRATDSTAVSLSDVRRTCFPASVSRASVARVMLDTLKDPNVRGIFLIARTGTPVS